MYLPELGNVRGDGSFGRILPSRVSVFFAHGRFGEHAADVAALEEIEELDGYLHVLVDAFFDVDGGAGGPAQEHGFDEGGVGD